MAFCPNCGTPNTEQATKCVNCANALAPATGNGGKKFKGTIMMGGAGGVSPGAPAQPQPPGQPAAAPAAQGERDNMAYQRTMLGPMVAPPVDPQAPAGAAAPASPPTPAAHDVDVAHAPTLEQTSPPAGAGSPAAPSPAPSAPRALRFSEPEVQLPQSNATRMMLLVLGAAVVIAALIVGVALFMRGQGGESAEETSWTPRALPAGPVNPRST